jgi:ring-1,2-phenylacetyl-CoA epoxidase subunit PaaD
MRHRSANETTSGAGSTVPDPEIPAISVVDLGIVRDMAWEGEDRWS